MIPVAIGAYAALVALAPTPALQALLCAPLVVVPLAFRAVFSHQGWIPLFFVCTVLLPPLPFALGDTGPHPAILIAALALCAGIVRLREWDLRFDALSISMLALFAVLLWSTALAAVYSGVPAAFGSLARVLLFGIAVYTFLYVANGPARYTAADIRGTARLLFAAGCASALFACLDFYYQFPAPAGYGPQFVWLEAGVFRRAQGFFYEASTLGNFCAFFIVMVSVALFRRDSWAPCSRRILVAGGVVFSAALIFSYSRASLLNVVVALIALAYLQRVKIRRALVIVTVSAGAAVVVAGAAFPEFTQSYWRRLSMTFEFLWAASPENVLSGRLASWRTLLEFLQWHPWHAILGIGYKTLPYSDFVGRPVIADNMYLSLLVETGIAGLLAFAVFNVAVLRSARRAAYDSDPQTAFFGRWIFCFWAGQLVQMLSGDLLTYWRVLPVYFWVLAVAVRNARPVSRPVQ